MFGCEEKYDMISGLEFGDEGRESRKPFSRMEL
jgi:hypothetical protein